MPFKSLRVLFLPGDDSKASVQAQTYLAKA